MRTALPLLLIRRMLCITFCLLFFSCYTPRYVYSPAAHNVPVLLKKGDSKLAFNLSSNFSGKNTANNIVKDNKSRGVDLQGAYAVTKNWAVQYCYYHRTEKNNGNFDSGNLDSVEINYKRNLTEFGVGYFKNLSTNSQAVFQVFAGVGFGKFSFTDIGRDQNNTFHNNYHNMSVTKIYLQPAFMVHSKKRFSFALSSRFSLVYFSKIKTNYTATELDNYKLDSLNFSPRLFWEPAIVNTFGFKKLPGLQLEFQIDMTSLVSRRFVDYRAFNFSAGLLFDLPKLFALARHSSKN